MSLNTFFYYNQERKSFLSSICFLHKKWDSADERISHVWKRELFFNVRTQQTPDDQFQFCLSLAFFKMKCEICYQYLTLDKAKTTSILPFFQILCRKSFPFLFYKRDFHIASHEIVFFSYLIAKLVETTNYRFTGSNSFISRTPICQAEIKDHFLNR